MAQLVARFHGMEEVRGSNPLSSTFCFPGHRSDGVPGFLVAWDALGTGSPMSVLFRFWVADVNAFSVLGRQYRHRSPVFGRIIGDVCRHRQPHRALRRKGCGYPSHLYDRSPLPPLPALASGLHEIEWRNRLRMRDSGRYWCLNSGVFVDIARESRC